MITPFDKIALFTDIHFGRKSGSEIANKDNEDFVRWFIEQCQERGITKMAFLGDWFDHRNSIQSLSLDYGLRSLELLNDAFETAYIIVGNHDLFFRDRRDVSSMNFARHLDNIVFVNEPLTVGEGRESITFLPWLIGDEHKQLKYIKSRYIFTHAELGSFMMNAKVLMPERENGLNSKSFPNQDLVASGHYHYRQQGDNVHYIGNVFPFDFSDDWSDERGMAILEWGQKEFEYIAWPEQPLYRTMKLSDLLNDPDRFLKPKLTARVLLDLDIGYEDTQIIKDEYIERYGLRKLEMLHQSKKALADQEFTTDVVFQSVDQIVVDGLESVKSDMIKSDKLIDIYNNL